jgi:diguanylate cyclase (GGDEF)-like protein
VEGQLETHPWVARAPLRVLIGAPLAVGALIALLLGVLPAPLWVRTALLELVMLAALSASLLAAIGRRRRECGRGRVGWTLMAAAFALIACNVTVGTVMILARRSAEPVPVLQALTGLGLLVFGAGLVALFGGAPLGSRWVSVVDTVMAAGACLFLVRETLVPSGHYSDSAAVIFSDLGGIAILLILALLLALRWNGDGRTLALLGAGLGVEALTLIGLSAASAQGHSVSTEHPVIGTVFPVGTFLLGLGAAQRPTGPTAWAPMRRHWNLAVGLPVICGVVVAVTAAGATFSGRPWDAMDTALALPVVLALFVRQGVTLLENRRTSLVLDPLTGLGNRAHVHERMDDALARARRTGSSTCLVYVDLDDFKRLNDVEGHSVGDQVLVEAAQVIRSMVGARGTAARLGGDEFAVLLEDADAAHGEAVARSVVTALQQLPVQRVHLSGASAGVSVVVAGRGDAESLLRDADIALHRAKAHGRGRAAVFQPAMREQLVRELALEESLARAIADRQLSLAYQPIVELATGRLAGVEALVRWYGDDGVPISPDVFIPVAERAGLVGALDEWVLRQACVFVASLGDRCPELAGITLNVNLSARDLEDVAEVRRWVLSALAVSGLPPHRLMLEITETAVMPEHVSLASLAAALQALRSRGVRIALDDFGTGYSSVTSLERLPLDELKVDGTFVAGLTEGGPTGRLVEGLVSMARSLRLPVVAEAVETQEQATMLRAMRCEYGQGYLFARPMPGAELEAWAKARGAGAA